MPSTDTLDNRSAKHSSLNYFIYMKCQYFVPHVAIAGVVTFFLVFGEGVANYMIAVCYESDIVVTIGKLHLG